MGEKKEKKRNDPSSRFKFVWAGAVGSEFVDNVVKTNAVDVEKAENSFKDVAVLFVDAERAKTRGEWKKCSWRADGVCMVATTADESQELDERVCCR
jgi:hypothetical protein